MQRGGEVSAVLKGFLLEETSSDDSHQMEQWVQPNISKPIPRE